MLKKVKVLIAVFCIILIFKPVSYYETYKHKNIDFYSKEISVREKTYYVKNKNQIILVKNNPTQSPQESAFGSSTGINPGSGKKSSGGGPTFVEQGRAKAVEVPQNSGAKWPFLWMNSNSKSARISNSKSNANVVIEDNKPLLIVEFEIGDMEMGQDDLLSKIYHANDTGDGTIEIPDSIDLKNSDNYLGKNG
jgi:hypothetical protein